MQVPVDEVLKNDPMGIPYEEPDDDYVYLLVDSDKMNPRVYGVYDKNNYEQAKVNICSSAKYILKVNLNTRIGEN